MDMTERSMDRVRQQITAGAAAIPALHIRATDLGLSLQPWWNKDAYEHHIKIREAELEVKGRSKEDTE